MSDVARVLPWSSDEVELVTELQGGSCEAFDWLVTHYSGPVYGLVAGMVSESSDAADITQDVFLKAFRGIRGFRRGSSLKTWLYRIAIREALNHRRWLWRHHREQDSIDADPADGHALMEIEDERGTPFDEAVSHEVQQAVQGALRSVPEVFRSAVILRDLEGMSYEEVAEVLSVSVGTVKSRILRGRRLLREILEPVLRSPHCAHVTVRATQGKSIVHSTLFPAAGATTQAIVQHAAENVAKRVEDVASSVANNVASNVEDVVNRMNSSRSDTAGWAFSGKSGNAEGGV